ncbi:protein YgfX [Dyella sp. A6]|uniref:protein YgfX n=1 Tax=Dyella aluminiiresistens TaxID=3069105 RepID=UPI002E778286|nr:protein YgfX [Dyella sp. A6]
MTSAPAIGFEYRPSHWPLRLLTVVLLLALVAVLSCGLAVWVKGLSFVALLGAWYRTLRHPSDAGVTAAGWAGGSGATWRLHRQDGTDLPARLLSFRVFGSAVLLRLRDADDAVVVLWLAPDNSDADIRRRLRMRLAMVRPETTPRHV